MSELRTLFAPNVNLFRAVDGIFRRFDYSDFTVDFSALRYYYLYCVRGRKGAREIVASPENDTGANVKRTSSLHFTKIIKNVRS